MCFKVSCRHLSSCPCRMILTFCTLLTVFDANLVRFNTLFCYTLLYTPCLSLATKRRVVLAKLAFQNKINLPLNNHLKVEITLSKYLFGCIVIYGCQSLTLGKIQSDNIQAVEMRQNSSSRNEDMETNGKNMLDTKRKQMSKF